MSLSTTDQEADHSWTSKQIYWKTDSIWLRSNDHTDSIQDSTQGPAKRQQQTSVAAAGQILCGTFQIFTILSGIDRHLTTGCSVQRQYHTEPPNPIGHIEEHFVFHFTPRPTETNIAGSFAPTLREFGQVSFFQSQHPLILQQRTFVTQKDLINTCWLAFTVIRIFSWHGRSQRFQNEHYASGGWAGEWVAFRCLQSPVCSILATPRIKSRFETTSLILFDLLDQLPVLCKFQCVKSPDKVPCLALPVIGMHAFAYSC